VFESNLLAVMETAAGFADMAGLADMSWRTVLEMVLSTPAHTDLSIPKLHVPHPSIVEGFVKHFGGLGWQWGTYRLPLPDGREFHVKEYAQNFLAHWDKESAVRNPLGHLLRDAPHWVILGGVMPAAAVAVVRGLWQGSKAKRRVKTDRKK
jgi:hypothetical protein